MPFKLPDKDEYLGNIWGWKVSYWSLALILVVFAVMIGRSCYLDKHPEQRVQQPAEIDLVK